MQDPSSRGPLDSGALDRRIEQRLADRERRTVGDLQSAFGRVGWMASAPFVTTRLVDAAGVRDAQPAFDSLTARGLVSARVSTQSDGDSVFAMTAAGRQAVLDLYSRDRSIKVLRDSVSSNATKLGHASNDWPEPVQRWCEMAQYATNGHRAAAVLDEHVNKAYEDRDGAALQNWMETARPIADILARDLDNDLDGAIDRAGRKLELLHRLASDERHLKSFLERTEQVAALRELIEGPADRWALHLFGVGGVGKTMLLRYLTGHLAPRVFDVATARIDFDYLNPDYPSLDPGLLLWSFAQELRAHDTANGDAQRRFDDAELKLRKLKLELTSTRGGRIRATEHPVFVDAIVNFIDGLKALKRRVILIVDTCEELAKIRPDGSMPESVEETFRILTALHDGTGSLVAGRGRSSGLESLRVVFAGRRPLASAGHGWTCPVSAQPARPFLSLHELRGFTREESAIYLRTKMGVPEDLIDAVIDRSPDVGAPQVIQWQDTTLNEPPAPRCNPYDLRLYADWALESPPPTANTIRESGAAQYVELRILRRLESYEPLRQLMPVVAVVKYLDLDLITAALRDPDVAAQTHERLRDQEWIGERRVQTLDQSSSRAVLGVEEGLRQRLWAYYNGIVPADMLKGVLDHFEKVTLDADLNLLDWAYFDAALRALEASPDRAAAWWTRVEDRIIRERGYEWLYQITSPLLAPQNAAGIRQARQPGEQPTSRIRAAICASYLAALTHTRRPRTGEITWQSVLNDAPAYPSGSERDLLVWRARAGLIVEAASSAKRDQDAIQNAMKGLDIWPVNLSNAQQAEAAAAAVAAHEAAIEFLEDTGGRRSTSWFPLLSVLDGPTGPRATAQRIRTIAPASDESRSFSQDDLDGLAAFADVLALRITYSLVNPQLEELAKSIGLVRVRSIVVWRDWMSPVDLSARLQLEYVRAVWPWLPGWPGPPESSTVLRDVPGAADNIDRDRLVAFVRLHQSGFRLRPISSEKSWLDDAGQPACAAHRAVPPLAVVAASQLADVGRVAEAISALRALVRANSGNYAAALHAERALGVIALRFRLVEIGEQIPRALSESGEISDRALVWTAASRVGDTTLMASELPSLASSDLSDPAAWAHANWQSRAALTPEAKASTLAWAEHLLSTLVEGTPAGDYRVALRRLDKVEADLLAERSVDAAVIDQTGASQGEGILPGPVLPAYPNTELEELEVALRKAALTARTDRPLDEYARGVGFRRGAELALTIGDSLMMRLPAQSLGLFGVAAEWFEAAGDRVGAFLARLRAAVIDTTEVGGAADAYRALREPLRDLPALDVDADNAAEWNEFAASALKATAREWQPSVARLLVCLKPEWSSFQDGTATLTFGPDVDAAIVRMRKPVVIRDDVTPTSPSWPRRIWVFVRGVIQFVFGWSLLLAGLGFVVSGVAKAFGYFDGVVTDWLPATTSFGLKAALFAGVIVASVGSVWLIFRQLFKLWASLVTATISIEPTEASEGYQSRSLERAARLTLEARVPSLRTRIPFVEFNQVEPFVTEVMTGGLDAYAITGHAFNTGIGQKLLNLPGVYKHFPTRVNLVVHRSLHGSSWEGILQFAAGLDRKRLPLSCYRGRASTHQGTPDAPPGTSNVLVLAADPSAQVLADRGWAPLDRFWSRRRWQVRLEDPTEMRFGTESWHEDAPVVRDPGVSVIHLLGRVEDRASGLVFVCGNKGATGQSAQWSDASYEIHSGFRSNELLDRYPEAHLIILQPEPLSVWPEIREPSDREAAARLRLFAGQITDSGGPTILVLPRLDTRDSVFALQCAAAMLRYRRVPDHRHLTEVAVGIQRRILRHAGNPEVATEVCCDVTVSASAEFSEYGRTVALS